MDAVYQPVGGPGWKVMPPTYPAQDSSPYLLEERWIDGEKTATVIMDQVPSQANRVEQALLAAHDEERVTLPLFVLDGDGQRLTSLDFPHRYADAYLRDSEVGGVRFDDSEVGRAMRMASVEDVRPLYQREPYSLVFGAWDSHRKGRWPKFARLYSSAMYGTDPLLGDRRGGRMDPLNLVGAVDDISRAETDWGFVAEGAKAKGKKLSEIGHGNIAPNPVHGGVSVREVRRQGWISFASLARLRFGDASAEAAVLARACLAALALAGDRLAFGEASVSLRSGCDLVRVSESVAFEVVGGGREPIDVTAADAITAFTALRDQAAAVGLAMTTDTIQLTPTSQLRAAMAYARTKATPDAGD
jgi:CRISPR-associated protein Csb1